MSESDDEGQGPVETVARPLAKAAKRATNVVGLVTNIGELARDTKKGRYTKNYDSDIQSANREAVASAASYIYANPDNVAVGATKEFLRENMPGFEIVKTLSDGSALVLKNDQTKEVVVSYKGTSLGNWKDLEADVTIALEGNDYSHDDEFKRALSRFEDAQRMLRGYNFTVTGHSLGGSKAMWVARHHPSVNAKVFNPGIVGLTGAQKLAMGTRNVADNMFHMRDRTEGQEYNNITILRMDGDLVSGGYVSRVGFEETMADGEKVSDAGHLIRPFGHNGAKLVNAKYTNKKDHGVNWTIKAHALQNFLTEEQSKSYRKLAKIQKTGWIYDDSDGNPVTNAVKEREPVQKTQSSSQLTGKKRVANEYHHKVHTPHIDI